MLCIFEIVYKKLKHHFQATVTLSVGTFHAPPHRDCTVITAMYRHFPPIVQRFGRLRFIIILSFPIDYHSPVRCILSRCHPPVCVYRPVLYVFVHRQIINGNSEMNDVLYSILVNEYPVVCSGIALGLSVSGTVAHVGQQSTCTNTCKYNLAHVLNH